MNWVWAGEPWSRGLQQSFLTTGAWMAYVASLCAPVGHLRRAGAEVSPVFVGQMEGAIRTAEAAVHAILKEPNDG